MNHLPQRSPHSVCFVMTISRTLSCIYIPITPCVTQSSGPNDKVEAKVGPSIYRHSEEIDFVTAS